MVEKLGALSVFTLQKFLFCTFCIKARHIQIMRRLDFKIASREYFKVVSHECLIPCLNHVESCNPVIRLSSCSEIDIPPQHFSTTMNANLPWIMVILGILGIHAVEIQAWGVSFPNGTK